LLQNLYGIDVASSMRCPSSRYNFSIVATGDEVMTLTYGRNASLGYMDKSNPENKYVKVSRVKYPTLRIGFGDRAEGIQTAVLYGSIDGQYRPLDDRHLRSTPIAFLDGHVESLNPYQTNSFGVVLGEINSSTNEVSIPVTPGYGLAVYPNSKEKTYMWGYNGGSGDYTYDYP
jgi:prepilin-type processing-associated H-X9-DG protein